MKVKLKKLKNYISGNDIAFMLVLATGINLIIETLSRGSLFEVFAHIRTSWVFFAFNISIIALSLSISLFFKKKKFVSVIISIIWIALGIANYVVLSYRVTPFAFIDLFILKLNLDFLQSYLSVWLVVGLIIAVPSVIFIIGTAFKKCSKTSVNVIKSVKVISLLVMFVVSFYNVSLWLEVYENRISDMSKSYDKFGFVTCFVRSSFERGIDKPENYSLEEVNETILEIEKIEDIENPDDIDITPNIIVVQLESFFDTSLLEDTTFSKNPIPAFSYLMDNYTSGMLDVAVVGAGTANTEFEVVTGMNIDFFGTGEYPYSTFLKKQTCDSLAYNLKDLDYNTFAIHNNTATFYDRNIVYPNLGFDYFISSEFMTNPTTTPEGWIKDENLTEEIVKCLDYTENQDFVFVVSVQGHGAFPKEEMENPAVMITSSPFEEELENQVEYYVNQINEMDQFVSDLIISVNNRREPTVVVFYGDHIPSLNIEASDLITNNNYQTQYVIWSNLATEQSDEDIQTYQLSSKMLEVIGMEGGVINDYHHTMREEKDYLENLELLQYDIIYGEKYALDGMVYNPTDMKMGVGEISVKAYIFSEYLVLESEDLTESSKVFADDKLLNGEFTDNKLYVKLEDIEEDVKLYVKQVSIDNVILSETEVDINL